MYVLADGKISGAFQNSCGIYFPNRMIFDLMAKTHLFDGLKTPLRTQDSSSI